MFTNPVTMLLFLSNAIEMSTQVIIQPDLRLLHLLYRIPMSLYLILPQNSMSRLMIQMELWIITMPLKHMTILFMHEIFSWFVARTQNLIMCIYIV